MKLIALFLFCFSLLWYLAGVGVLYWIYPAIQSDVWWNIGHLAGVWDFVAGIVNGLSIDGIDPPGGFSPWLVAAPLVMIRLIN